MKFSIGSLRNRGQSRGSTPTPSQQTSSHAPGPSMHAAGTQPMNPQLPPPPLSVRDEALQKAMQDCILQLSGDDKVAFESAPDVIERLQEMQYNDKSAITPSSLATRVAKVLQCIKQFMGSLAIFIQHHPEISSLVVGGVNCILTVGTSSILASY